MDKITVIYSNFGDVDTSLLVDIWKGLDSVNVVEVKSSLDRPKVDEAISQECDLLIICGHGTPEGLFGRDFHYLVDASNYSTNKAKNVIGVWCNADAFAEKYNANGFFSSMFISNVGEASYCGIPNSSSEDINGITTMFCRDLNKLIKDKTPIDKILPKILEMGMNSKYKENAVFKYNYFGLSYFD